MVPFKVGGKRGHGDEDRAAMHPTRNAATKGLLGRGAWDMVPRSPTAASSAGGVYARPLPLFISEHKKNSASP